MSTGAVCLTHTSGMYRNFYCSCLCVGPLCLLPQTVLCVSGPGTPESPFPSVIFNTGASCAAAKRSTTSQLRKLSGTSNLHRHHLATIVPTDQRASGRTFCHGTHIMHVYQLLDDTVVSCCWYVQRDQSVSTGQVQWITHVLTHHQTVHVPGPTTHAGEPHVVQVVRLLIRSRCVFRGI